MSCQVLNVPSRSHALLQASTCQSECRQGSLLRVCHLLDCLCSGLPAQGSKTSVCWLYRLYENGRKVQEHLEAERRNAEEHPVDPATGQPFFHPQIGRGPKHQRNEQNKPIGDYLHNFK